MLLFKRVEEIVNDVDLLFAPDSFFLLFMLLVSAVYNFGKYGVSFRNLS